jgi:Glycosyltransferase
LPGSGVNLTDHPFREYPSEEDGIRFLAVIRIMKDKGIEEYLKAAEEITSADDKVFFDLVGEYEEDEREKYEPMIRALEEKGVVKYHGHLDSVEPVMANSHVIVHPSYHEGLSNVLLEAGACGRPVLATDVNGCKETFEEGVTGIGFKPGNASALSDAIHKILAIFRE